MGLNVITGINYLSEFFVADNKQRFVNMRGITGNRDIDGVSEKIKSSGTSEVSIFLTNGLETAWVANSLRDMKFNKVTHNLQPLQEKEYSDSPCGKIPQDNWPPSGLMIITNPNLARSDITALFEGGKVIYQNDSYMVIDPAQLQSLIYIGLGAYSVEHYKSENGLFPSKFRWVEKNVEVFLYSNKDKVKNLVVEVAPGYVETKDSVRHITIKTAANQYNFILKGKNTFIVPSLKLHKGLNCLVIGSPDEVTRRARYSALMRAGIPLDPRLNNFVVSYIGLQDAKSI